MASCEKKVYEADLLNKKVYVRDFKSPTPSTVPVKEIDQLTEELKDFVKAIKSGSPPKVSGEDAYRILQLAEEVSKLRRVP